MKKIVYPEINTQVTYTIDFSIPVTKGSISSNGFRISGNSSMMYFDDSNGVLNLFYISNGLRVQHSVVGSIDYTNGIISIPNLMIDSVDGDSVIKITASPQSLDVVPKRNILLTFASDDIKVTSAIGQS